MKSTEADLLLNLAELIHKHSELTRIIKGWPGLPEHIKAAIKALVQTHIRGD